MKAREVVEGWPRGRSCSEPFHQDRGGYVGWWLPYRVRDPFDQMLVREEQEAELEYRRGQARMVDLWRTGRVEVKTAFEMMGWEAYKTEPSGGYHTYLMPKEGTGEKPMNLWPKPNVGQQAATPDSITWQNDGSEVDRLLFAAYHALRSYALGNVAPQLAAECADAIDLYRQRRARNKNESDSRLDGE